VKEDQRPSRQLQKELEQLRQRVAELEQTANKREQAEKTLAQRASQLQIISQVAKKAASILDSDALLSYTAKAIPERLGYYHVDIFLVDQDQRYAVFATGSNPVVEKERKERNLRFKVGEEGMIGWVAKNGEPLLANDVSQEPRYLPDELLPETKSELVVPLKAEDQTIGVLDVDSDELNAFDEEDVLILRTLADQLAIAVENARMYKQAQQLAAFNESIVKNVLVGISVEDADGNFTFLNPAAAALLGYSADELIGQHWTTVVPPDQHAIVRTALRRRRREKGNFYELEIIRKDGTRRCILVSGSPQFEEGYYLGAQAVFTDITPQKQAEKEIRELNQYLESVIDNANVWLNVLDKEGNVLVWNKAAEEISGYLREEVVGHNKIWEWSYPHEEYRKELTAHTKAIIRDGKVREGFETTIRCKDGSSKVILWNERRLLDTKGIPVGSIAVALNITERKQAEEALRESEERFRQFFENEPGYCYMISPEGVILDVNIAALNALGYKKEELAGKPLKTTYAPESLPRMKQLFVKWKETGELSDEEMVISTKEGDRRTVLLSTSVVKDRDGKTLHSVSVQKDITERKRAEERLAHIATHDPLTGLPNRQALNDRLDLELSHAHRNKQKLAVIMLDLDHFKNVNDTLGHSMGDQLLKAVGNRLTSLQRKSDTIARLGGDEFMLILPEISETVVAEEITRKLLDAVREPYVIDGHKLCITTSIGVVIYPEDAEDRETLVKNADIAMYRAKEMGRNTYQRYTPS